MVLEVKYYLKIIYLVKKNGKHIIKIKILILYYLNIKWI